MKWLLLLLVSINVILLVVQIKERNEIKVVSEFNRYDAAKELKLLKDVDQRVVDRCLVVGAITEKTAVDTIEKYLNELEIKYDLIEKEEELAPSYWVYIVDEVTQGLLDNLTGMGVESYVIASGELKGQLSVGLFANIDLAKDMIDALKKAQVNANLIEKRRVKKTQWISLRVAQLNDKERLVQKIKEMQINLGEIKEFFCKSIASEK